MDIINSLNNSFNRSLNSSFVLIINPQGFPGPEPSLGPIQLKYRVPRLASPKCFEGTLCYQVTSVPVLSPILSYPRLHQRPLKDGTPCESLRNAMPLRRLLFLELLQSSNVEVPKSFCHFGNIAWAHKSHSIYLWKMYTVYAPKSGKDSRLLCHPLRKRSPSPPSLC